MYADLQRLNTGQGFIAYYPYKNGVKSVAVLLRDDRMPENAKADALTQLQDHFVTMNGVNVDAQDLIERPTLYDLSADNNYVMAAETAISTDMPKNLMVCDGWDVYADVCTVLGVTRSDHLRLATQYGWDDPSIPTVKKAQAPKSCLNLFAKQISKGIFLSPEEDRDRSKTAGAVLGKRHLLQITKAFLSGNSRHIHLGTYSLDVQFDASEANENLHNRFLPQPKCIFEYELIVDDDGHKNTVLVFAEESKGKVFTYRFLKGYDQSYFSALPVGMIWSVSDHIDPFVRHESWVKPRNPETPFSQESMDFMFRIDVGIIFPALNIYHDMGRSINRCNHDPVMAKSVRKAGIKDFYCINPKLIEESQDSSLRLLGRRNQFKRAGTALHEVDKHRRRRPNSAPGSPKSVDVVAHKRGSEEFGTSGCIVGFTSPNHPRLR